MKLLIGLFTYLPMIFLLFTNKIMHTKTTGKSIPFKTCDHSEIRISGALGNQIIPADKIKIPV